MNRYVIDYENYAKVARQAAAEGIVLLKNESNALPLQSGEKVAVFGRIQFDYYKSGTGSGGLVNTPYVVSILDALKEEALVLNQELMNVYGKWLEDHPFDMGKGWAQEPWSQEEMYLTDAVAEQAANVSDTAIVIIGRTAGEDSDAENAKGSYLLSDTEDDMLGKVCKCFSKVVVLLNVGSIMDMSWIEKYRPDSVLYVWQGGTEGGHGVSDVLMGRVSPCGKLSDTIAKSITDYPSDINFGGKEKNIYAEDIYVGYRYFETFAKESVLYPFGYGLSYTKFDVNTISLKHHQGQTEIVVNVKNTGKRAGKEVIQAYVKAPQGKLGKPLRSLVAYGKTKELQVDEEQEMRLTVSDYMLAAYDDSGVTRHRWGYVLEGGVYEFYIGTDVRSTVFAGSFEIANTKLIEQLQEAAAPAQPFQRMKAKVVDEKCCALIWENAPLRSKSVAEHIQEDFAAGKVADIPYTGDKGFKLGDVYDGKVTVNDFLAQLSDYDLCCIVKGEGMSSPKVTPGTTAAFGGITEGLKAFGIPCGCCADGPSGIRMDCGTTAFSLPGGTCLACTFNDDLNETLYTFEGAELRKNRIDTLLGPGINIHRHPLNGRNFEYFSEDPLLTGKMAAAQLRGMGRYGVTGTIKHFACNNQEFRRRRCDAIVSERALREIYLKGFEIAAKEGGAYAVMTAYGAVNGVYTAGNYDLCTRILREEWGFEGMVMTDWWSDINEEGKPASREQYGAMVKAQNDIYMVVLDTTEKMGNLEACLADGSLTRNELARCAKNILVMLMKSPTMERFLGRTSTKELEAEKQTKTEQSVNGDIAYLPLDERLELSVEHLCTDRGKDISYGLLVQYPGVHHTYTLHMRVKVDANDTAQVPLTVFLNNAIKDSVTLSGTKGKWVDLELNLGHARYEQSYLKLHFALGGMQIQKMEVVRND